MKCSEIIWTSRRQIAVNKIIKLVILLLSFNNILMAEEKIATFAGGCFWCVQPTFDKAEGVIQTTVGYTGGAVPEPKYEMVCSGKTGHAESINIKFDSDKTSYSELLELFFTNIDPFDGGGQFYDRGSEYRTVIFYHSEEQKAEAQKYISELTQKFGRDLAVGIEPAKEFYPAEDYHQKYYEKNPGHYNLYKIGSGRDGKLKKIWE